MTSKSTKKILMVDDDEDVRKLLEIFFNLAGYEIFYAINGEEAKEQLKTQTPDLIILDMMMPVLDGMGFLQWLRSEAQLDIPVVSLTGRFDSKTKSEALALGASEVFFKPCDPATIVDYVKTRFEQVDTD
jgi:DNA-binding response OmpR family regulator